MRVPLIRLGEVLDWEKEQNPKINPSLREAFDCGQPSLNIFLSKYARQSEEQNTARTWITLDKPNKKIIGYVSISNTSIEKQEAAPLVKSYVNPIPALLIARLAVDRSYKRQGWGEEILLGAFQKAKEINEISAIQEGMVITRVSRVASQRPATLISQWPSPGVPGSSTINGGPPCANAAVEPAKTRLK